MSNTKTVMIVDDDVIFADELKEALLLSGYWPAVESNALAAVDKIKVLRPDIILLDLNMPFKTGFQIAEELMALGKGLGEIPVIAMTGQYKPFFEPAFKTFRIKKCLKKPFLPLDVISVIEDY